MFYISLFILFVLVLYFGQAIGLMIYCETCAYLKDVKNHAFAVPFLTLKADISCLFECFKNRNWKFLREYFFFGNRNLVILCLIKKHSMPESDNLNN